MPIKIYDWRRRGLTLSPLNVKPVDSPSLFNAIAFFDEEAAVLWDRDLADDPIRGGFISVYCSDDKAIEVVWRDGDHESCMPYQSAWLMQGFARFRRDWQTACDGGIQVVSSGDMRVGHFADFTGWKVILNEFTL